MQPAWTYMLRDLGGSLWGVLVFTLALLAPGYAVGYVLNVCDLRRRGLREQAAWSIVLSFGTGTIATVAVVWAGGTLAGSVFLITCSVLAVLIAIRQRLLLGLSLRKALPYFGLAALVCVLCIGSLADVGVRDHLHMSVTAYDNAIRTAFVQAVMRTGVPPASPVYWPGHDAPMHYYYFWYVLCAVVAQLAHISAKEALIASSVWSVFGVVAALALFCKYLLNWRGNELQRRWWIAVALLSVTGLDGLIACIVFLHSRTVARDIEWWSLDQVTSWADTFLWVPHHAAALVCAVLSILLIWISTQSDEEGFSKAAVLAGIAFASSFGLSVYVAAGVLLILAAWFVRQATAGKAYKLAKVYLWAGLSAALVLSPYVIQLLRPQAGARQHVGAVLTLGVRELLPPVVLSGLPFLRSLGMTHAFAAKEIAAALLLIPSYFLEFGFFAVGLLIVQRHRSKNEGERALLFFTWTGLVVVSVVRSRVIAMNDFAVRATLLPQFMLLLICVLALDRARGLQRLLLVALLVIGSAGSIYQVGLLRTFLPLHEKAYDTQYADISRRNYLLRDAYAGMQARIGPLARVQFSVPSNSYTGFAQLGNVGRQVIVESDQCNDSFGGDITPCAEIQQTVAQLFSEEHATSDVDAMRLCLRIGAQYLVAASWDPVWNQKGGWVWSLPAIVTRPDVRILSCSPK